MKLQANSTELDSFCLSLLLRNSTLSLFNENSCASNAISSHQESLETELFKGLFNIYFTKSRTTQYSINITNHFILLRPAHPSPISH